MFNSANACENAECHADPCIKMFVLCRPVPQNMDVDDHVYHVYCIDLDRISLICSVSSPATISRAIVCIKALVGL
jgi:hypothetical protein